MIQPGTQGGVGVDGNGHQPVLLSEVMAGLAVERGRQYIDGTLGAGGYSRAILERGGTVLAIDRDPTVGVHADDIKGAYGPSFQFTTGNFGALDELAMASGIQAVDGVVLDIGVSSMQLDEPDRGFSFRFDGPLDMRMDGVGPTAADIVNRAPESDLAIIIRVLGEDSQARRIAKAIANARKVEPIVRTGKLAEVVAGVVVSPRSRIHPATRTFQALRIFINRELDHLAHALGSAERILGVGGRLVVVAFHSLEDRIVKRFIQSRSSTGGGSRHSPPIRGLPPTFVRPPGQPIKASDSEIQINPRARSARLRFAVRTEQAPLALNLADLGMPRLREIAGPEAYQ